MSTSDFLNMTEFSGKQVVRRAGFTLPCSAERAFPLFTPEAERVWAEGWEPTPIYPGKLVFTTDAVFELFQEGERSIWMVVRADMAAREAEYVSFVFTSRVARLRVQVQASGAESCTVSVEYAITGFTDAGARFVDGFTKEIFNRKLQGWQQKLTQVLQTK